MIESTKVFVHGNPETSAIWSPLVDELHKNGVANAGKMLKFEVFKSGNWINLGSARVTKSRATALTSKTSTLGIKGKLPIRAT